MNDFWIGDWVRDKVGNVYGTYEGNRTGMALVKIGGSIREIPENRLILLSDKEVEAIRMNERTRKSDKLKSKTPEDETFNDTIDLHIENLAPHLANRQVELILKKQLDAAKLFIEKAIDKRQLSITIIHGKGTGALKMEIMHMLEGYEAVYFTKPVNNEGAVQVLFQYS